MAKPRRHRNRDGFVRHSDQGFRRDPFANDLGEAIFESPPSGPLSGPALVENYQLAVDSLPPELVDRPRASSSSSRARGATPPRRHLVNVIRKQFSPVRSIGETDSNQARRSPQMVCADRAKRSEVLHALQKTGRGSRNHKPPRRTDNSNVRC